MEAGGTTPGFSTKAMAGQTRQKENAQFQTQATEQRQTQEAWAKSESSSMAFMGPRREREGGEPNWLKPSTKPYLGLLWHFLSPLSSSPPVARASSSPLLPPPRPHDMIPEFRFGLQALLTLEPEKPWQTSLEDLSTFSGSTQVRSRHNPPMCVLSSLVFFCFYHFRMCVIYCPPSFLGSLGHRYRLKGGDGVASHLPGM